MEHPRIIFFGTPDFSVPVLECLIHAGLAPVLVVTAPDAPKGRGLVLTPSPINITALAHNIPVITPATLRDEQTLASIRDAHGDVYVIAAYGKIIPESLLALPAHGTLNVHPSLLPKYRGPSPVASALRDGATETGTTIMLTDALLDHGPILAQVTHAIDPEDTTLSLTETLFKKGGELLIETLPKWTSGTITPTPQDESLATSTKKFTKAEGHIDWSLPATTIHNRVRAFTPWPSAWALRADDSRIIVLKTAVISDAPDIPVGTVFCACDSFAVRTGSGSLLLCAVTRAGKEPEVVTGYTSWLTEGERLH